MLNKVRSHALPSPRLFTPASIQCSANYLTRRVQYLSPPNGSQEACSTCQATSIPFGGPWMFKVRLPPHFLTPFNSAPGELSDLVSVLLQLVPKKPARQTKPHLCHVTDVQYGGSLLFAHSFSSAPDELSVPPPSNWLPGSLLDRHTHVPQPLRP